MQCKKIIILVARSKSTFSVASNGGTVQKQKIEMILVFGVFLVFNSGLGVQSCS